MGALRKKPQSAQFPQKMSSSSTASAASGGEGGKERAPVVQAIEEDDEFLEFEDEGAWRWERGCGCA